MTTRTWFSGKASLMALALLGGFLLAPDRADACACCAEPGAYRIGVSKPTASEIGLLEEMRFAQAGHLYAIHDTELPEDYTVSGMLSGKIWTLTLSEGMNMGRLNLSRPTKMVSYSADIHDGKTGGGGGPLLYKEWRFEGTASGTGFFKSSAIAPTKYFLVLQGRGNNCDNAEDFTNWRLEIKGRRETYSFYGEMAKR